MDKAIQKLALEEKNRFLVLRRAHFSTVFLYDTFLEILVDAWLQVKQVKTLMAGSSFLPKNRGFVCR